MSVLCTRTAEVVFCAPAAAVTEPGLGYHVCMVRFVDLDVGKAPDGPSTQYSEVHATGGPLQLAVQFGPAANVSAVNADDEIAGAQPSECCGRCGINDAHLG